MAALQRRAAAWAAVVCLAAGCLAIASDEPQLTEEQIKEFLLKAKIVKSRQTSKGVTAPLRLTLSDGTLTHDAAFQPIDERKGYVQMSRGTTEIGFRDSYHFNIAGYELAKLLGLGDMVPVTVERKHQGRKGSLSWWLPAKWDEEERLKQGLEPPDVSAWNKQMNRVWVFSELVYDTDFNQTNMLISEDWKLWRIDFSRAFRWHHKLENPARLTMCDRQLLERLRQLNEAQVLQATKPHLNKREVQALMARRGMIVAYFEQLVAEKGEERVLY